MTFFRRNILYEKAIILTVWKTFFTVACHFCEKMFTFKKVSRKVSLDNHNTVLKISSESYSLKLRNFFSQSSKEIVSLQFFSPKSSAHVEISFEKTSQKRFRSKSQEH